MLNKLEKNLQSRMFREMKQLKSDDFASSEMIDLIEYYDLFELTEYNDDGVYTTQDLIDWFNYDQERYRSEYDDIKDDAMELVRIGNNDNDLVQRFNELKSILDQDETYYDYFYNQMMKGHDCIYFFDDSTLYTRALTNQDIVEYFTSKLN